MRFVREYLHVLVLVALLLVLLRLQFSSAFLGWPFQTGLASIWANVIPAIIVLGLSMLPFGFNTRRSTSLGALFMFTVCAAVATIIIPAEYRSSFAAIDQLLIIFLFTMTIYGCASSIWRFIGSRSSLPSAPNREDT